MNSIARPLLTRILQTRTPARPQDDPRWTFSGRGPNREFQVDALRQRYRFLLGAIKRAA